MVTDYKEVFENAQTIAIIGASANKYRTSYHIASYLKENGFRIVPINPNYEEVLGLPCFDTMDEVPEKYSIDVVDIFRDSEHTAEMVRQIIEWSEKTGQKPLIWTQLDVSSDEAEALAGDAGLSYIKNECIMVQHEKLT